ncbi:Acyl-CoA thioester hydrolase YbgC [bacterium HR39]|nr:Acyl-CoA thioester hydrolase YbgC [bacterium HR39]
MSEAAHRHPVRVYYEDTDAAGIVYYANYLKFAERARTEWLRDLGYDHRTLAGVHGVRFAVRACRIDYLRPARLDDLLEVETRVLALSGARLVLDQRVLRAGEPLCTMEIVLVALDDALRPVRIERALPPAFVAALRTPGRG